MDSVQGQLIWHVFVIPQGLFQDYCVNYVLELILLMKDLVKADRLGKKWNASAACLVPMLKMRKIVSVTCLSSVVGTSRL